MHFRLNSKMHNFDKRCARRLEVANGDNAANPAIEFLTRGALSLGRTGTCARTRTDRRMHAHTRTHTIYACIGQHMGRTRKNKAPQGFRFLAFRVYYSFSMSVETHMLKAIKESGAAAVAAASIFHFTEITPNDIKDYLKENKIPIRDSI